MVFEGNCQSHFFQYMYFQDLKLGYQIWTFINFHAWVINSFEKKKKHLKENFYRVFEENRSSFPPPLFPEIHTTES